MPSPLWLIVPGSVLCLAGLLIAGWQNEQTLPFSRRLARLPGNLIAMLRGRHHAGLRGWIGLKVAILGIVAVLTGIALP